MRGHMTKSKRSHSQYTFSEFDPSVGEKSETQHIGASEPVKPSSPPAHADEPLAVREVLGLCPRLLAGLPLPCSLLCARADGAHVVITSSSAVYATASRSWPTFTAAELAAMALAAEHERASPAAFDTWCARKADAGSSWRLTSDVAIGAVAGRFEPRGYTIDRVLRAYGLELRAVGLDTELPLPATFADEVSHAAE